MGKIFAVTNQKGGVGKTTTVVNLAAALGKTGQKVLCVDMDPQGNATTGLGMKKKDLDVSTYDIILGRRRIKDGIKETEFENVHIVGSTSDLAAADIELIDRDKRNLRLRMQLLTVKENYDYILIDCPPSLSLLTINAICAANSLIIPMLCDFYSMEGLSQLINFTKKINRHNSSEVNVEGILFTQYDRRLVLAHQVIENVKSSVTCNVYETVIPKNVRISEAPSFGKPVIYYDKSSSGSMAYTKLAQEIQGRCKPPVRAAHAIQS